MITVSRDSIEKRKEVLSKDINVVNIISAEQMMDSVKKILPVDIAICAAAVSDFKPDLISKNKLKTEYDNLNSIKMKKNQDILEYLGKNNKSRPKIVVGFSAETKNLIKNSMVKLKNKHCDFIVANDISKKDIGFNVDYNKVTIIDKKGISETIAKNKKSFIATLLAKKILKEFLVDDKNIN